MATKKQIKDLLKMGLAIWENDIEDAMEYGHVLKKEKTIEDTLSKNLEYIDFKKLLIISVKRKRDLVDGYEKDNIPFLSKVNEMELEKLIKFAKKYIKPEEFIKVGVSDYKNGMDNPPFKIVDSKTIIYGEKLKENKKFQNIKNILPDIKVSGFLNLLKNVLEDKNMAEKQFTQEINKFLEKEGFEEEKIDEFWKGLKNSKSDEEIEETFQIVDEKKFNKRIRELLEELEPYINTDRCILFYTVACIGNNLEKGEKLTEKELVFLDNLEELLRDISETTKNIDSLENEFGIKQVYGILSKWNSETKEYCTDKDLLSGKKLLSETKGYENHLTKHELKRMAEVEGNLLYLAQKKKLNNRDIEAILRNHSILEDTLIGLYQCGALTLKKVKIYAKEKEMNFDHIKEEIKKTMLQSGNKIDLNNQEIWDLFTPKEKLQMLVEKIDKGEIESIKNRIEELYDVQEIADLYIYSAQNQTEEQNQEIQEKKQRYEDLIKLHNALDMQSKDDIILLLDDELSDEMLMNLYSDNVINIDVLKSYGEEELVIETFHQGKIHEKDLRTVIMKCNIPLEENEIYQYYQNGILSSRDILDIYLHGGTNLEVAKKINEKLPEEEKINLEIKEEELAQLYEKSKKAKEQKNPNTDDIIKYKRYGLIYQTLIRAGLSEDEKLISDKKIIENIHNITSRDIMNLYKDNILTLETVLEHGGEELVKKLILQGDLRTNDAKNYLTSEKNSINAKEILQNPDMDETEKLIFIYTTYSDDKDKRDELIDYISAYTNDVKAESGIQKGESDGKTKEKSDYHQTVTDPYERWRLFNLLDKDYSRKYVGGYLVVKLHNTQKVIIEKMYEKRKGKNVSAYGTATFAMNEEEFEKIENELIKDEKFDIAKIRSISKEHPDMISKITHHPPVLDENGNEKTSWGKRLLEMVCDDEIEKVYSEEELKDIDECMKSIEKSRQELGR